MLKTILATAAVLGLLAGCGAPPPAPYQGWIEKQAKGKVLTRFSAPLPQPGMYQPPLDKLE